MKNYAIYCSMVFFNACLMVSPPFQSVFAQEQNPLENIGEFTSSEMENCLAKDHLPSSCFGEVFDACGIYVHGFTQNTYPCSTNARNTLRDWVVRRVAAQHPESSESGEIQETIRSAHEICIDLERLAVEMGQQRVGTHTENCRNEITILIADELWEAARSRP